MTDPRVELKAPSEEAIETALRIGGIPHVNRGGYGNPQWDTPRQVVEKVLRAAYAVDFPDHRAPLPLFSVPQVRDALVAIHRDITHAGAILVRWEYPTPPNVGERRQCWLCGRDQEWGTWHPSGIVLCISCRDAAYRAASPDNDYRARFVWNDAALSTPSSVRAQTLEEAAKVCDALAKYYNKRADETHNKDSEAWNMMYCAAQRCAADIRALATPQEAERSLGSFNGDLTP